MKEKTKQVVIGDAEYQLKRFPADVGSFILGRLYSGARLSAVAMIKAIGEVTAPTGEISVSAPEPDLQIRNMADRAFGALPFDERALVQRECLKACARMENDQPMPIIAASGCLIDDLELLLRLEMEALVFNFHDFFAGGGLNALLKSPAPRT